MPTFEYNFPAIRGVQAGREYYVSMCPLRLIPRIFLFDEDELRPELRSQRVLNKNRIPEIARYILANKKAYTFSALTASIDGKVRFEPLGTDESERKLGRLRIPMDARFVINDGQHRRAGIEAALRENPDIGDETISVVFFVDAGLTRCQQMFADLNRYAIRPTRSLSLLYDGRDDFSHTAKALLRRVPVFSDLTELERSTISNRSLKLFTLSGIYSATRSLLADMQVETADKRVDIAADYWCEVAKQIPDWQLAKERKVSTADLRRDYIHAHTLALAGLGRAGNTLIRTYPQDWQPWLAKLRTLDWSRSNSAVWEGRAMTAGRLSKKTVNVVLTGNVIKRHLGLELTADERQREKEFRRTSDGRRRGIG
jgi:DNA sulfur modification protein DndB